MERPHCRLFKQLAIITWLILAPIRLWAYTGGTGDPNDPYQIATAEDLMELRSSVGDYDASFVLTEDIDLDPNLSERYLFKDAVVAPAPSERTRFDAYFEGTFDGQGHTIFNLTIDGGKSLALFGRVADGAVIKNLVLEAVDIQGSDHVGALVGRNLGGTISACSSSGRIEGKSSVGGLVGTLEGGHVVSCSTANIKVVGETVEQNSSGRCIVSLADTDEVQGGSEIGGLVGLSMGGHISSCSSSAWVEGDRNVGGLVGIQNGGEISNGSTVGCVSGDENTGGLLGSNDSEGIITSSFSTAGVQGGDYAGGLVGYNGLSSSVTLCYSASYRVVSANVAVGGLVGINRGQIKSCYSTGCYDSDAYAIGGLVGWNLDGTIVGSYFFGRVTGAPVLGGGGLVGVNGDDGRIIDEWDSEPENALVRSSFSIGTCETYGENYVVAGGLVGSHENGTLQNCYSAVEVYSDYYVSRGLVGSYGMEGTVTNCFWDIDATGSETYEGTGLTTVAMQDPNTYLAAGWDFVGESDNGMADLWRMQPGGYPVLVAFDSLFPSFSQGVGTQDDPFVIRENEQIGWMMCRPLAHYCLGTDLDFSSLTLTKPLIAWFSGTLDGQGYALMDMSIESQSRVGMFGVLGRTAEIRDLQLQDIEVKGKRLVGGVAVENRGGTLLRCHVSGTVEGYGDDESSGVGVGGLIGLGTFGQVKQSSFAGTVLGHAWGGNYVEVGGLSASYLGQVEQSCFKGTVKAVVSEYGYVGGLFGSFYGGDSRITDCYSEGSCIVEDYDSYSSCIGGLIGLNNMATIENCYSTCQIPEMRYFGGLLAINNLYAVFGDPGEVLNSFWDTEVSGCPDSDGGGTGLSTIEMQDSNTYLEAGWDFVGETDNGDEDIWAMPENDYPRLWWESFKGGKKRRGEEGLQSRCAWKAGPSRTLPCGLENSWKELTYSSCW